jgi:tRNA dimethylallyltransferase
MKIIVIVGQTATGKSDFAVNTALKLKKKGVITEIISADSRQVYRGLNLGTGKITKKEMRGIPHHMLDVVLPKVVYTVAQYQKETQKIINDMQKRNIVPILVGGTGFYIDAVVNGTILPEVSPNKKLRAELASKTAPQLLKILIKLDPKRAQTIDHHNPVRLIRAIEIAKALGSVPPLTTDRKFEVTKIGLTLPDEILKEKIKTRLLARIKAGMLKEIKNLHDNGLSWKRMHDLGLEYRYGALYLQNKITKAEMTEKLTTEIWHYAKRQKTWFKKDAEIKWRDARKNM